MTGRIEADNIFMEKLDRVLQEAPKNLSDFYYSRNDLSIRSLYTYIIIISKFLKQVDKNVEEIQRSDIDAYFMQMARQRCSDSHKGTTYTALKCFFEYLTQNKVFSENPMQHISRTKMKKKTELRHDYLSKDEVIAFLKRVEQESNPFIKKRNKAILNLFLQTGMRVSALRELNLSDIDLQNNSIKITTKGEKAQIFTGIKGVMSFIKDYLNERELCIKSDSPALFVSLRGERIHDNTVRYLITKYASQITDKNITPHKLRASYCTMLYEDGVDLYVLKRLMGHEKLSTTEIYIRGQDNATGDAAQRIEKILSIR